MEKSVATKTNFKTTPEMITLSEDFLNVYIFIKYHVIVQHSV